MVPLQGPGTWGTLRPRSSERPTVDDIPSPSELRAAGRASTIVAYGTGLAGVAVGTWLLRQDELVLAVLTWVITFGVGACLVGVATLVRASAGLTGRLAKLDADVAALRRDVARREDGHDDDWRHRSPY
jgi:hypothetical protein